MLNPAILPSDHRVAGPFSHRRPKTGFTLVELLVSVTLTLLVVFAIVQIFDTLGSNMRTGQALIEMSGQMRTVTNRLQQDLDNITCQVKPWNDPESGSGYFMILEGLRTDRDADGNGLVDAHNGQATHFGDWDDVLAFTVRKPEGEFVGRVTYQHTVTGQISTATVTSKEAEVVWWTAILDVNDNGIQDPGETTVMLMRRVFLVRPNLNLVPGPNSVIPDGSVVVLAQTDVSIRADFESSDTFDFSLPNDDAARYRLNSLADLTQPHNRALNQRTNWISEDFFHDGFPDLISSDELELAPGEINADEELYTRGGLLGGYGDHTVLTDVLAFDVRVYDPLAPLVDVGPSGSTTGRILLSPGDADYPPVTQAVSDPAYRAAHIKRIVDNTVMNNTPTSLNSARYGSDWTANLVGRGAYVDLGYLVSPNLPDLGAAQATNISDLGQIGTEPDRRVSIFSGLPAFLETNNDGVFQIANERIWIPMGRTTNSPYGDVSGWLAPTNTPPSVLTATAQLGNDPGNNLTSNPRRDINAETNSTQIVKRMYAYDTWTSFYERDGVDQDGDGKPDEGTDGLDTDGINGVDDPGERETSPPYPVDLSGVEIRIRMMEFNTRQVRQVSVIGDFSTQ